MELGQEDLTSSPFLGSPQVYGGYLLQHFLQLQWWERGGGAEVKMFHYEGLMSLLSSYNGSSQ